MGTFKRYRAPGAGSSRGFTLIELMIAVAVVGILVGIAVPAYNDQVRKARRATGKADVLELVQALERFNTINGTFAGFPLDPVTSPRDGDAAYTIVPSNLTVSTYTLTATPENGQVEDRCGTLTIDQAGARAVSTGLDVEDCW